MRATYGHDERVGETRDGVGQLDTELAVVMVEPATRNDRAIVSCDACLREKTSQDVADDAPDSMRGEDLGILIVK